MRYLFCILLLFLFILCLFLFVYYINTHNNIVLFNNLNTIDLSTSSATNNFIITPEIEEDKFKKPFLWIYWENKLGKKTPPYIKLCIDTVFKHCSQSFDIILLDEKNIYNYLPELYTTDIDFSNLLLAQKVDYYRILLLHKYGGLYIDADTLVLKNPSVIIEKLDKYDFVGFGCTGINCNYGYGKPSNGIMASRPNGKLISRIKFNLESKLRNNNKKWDYFELGKFIIWEELNYLINNNGYEYYHFSNDFDGTRDINGNWIETSYLFSDKVINYKDPDNMLFIILYNSQMDDLRELNEETLLNSNLNISNFFRKSLNK